MEMGSEEVRVPSVSVSVRLPRRILGCCDVISDLLLVCLIKRVPPCSEPSAAQRSGAGRSVQVVSWINALGHLSVFVHFVARRDQYCKVASLQAKGGATI